MATKRTKHQKIYEQIALRIHTMIEQGDVSPGEKLPSMVELAAQFGVSRATVREAFSKLVGMGLIELRHGEGTFVREIDVQTMITEPMNAAVLLGMGDIRDLLEVRKLLEVGAVEFACERATTEHLERMRQAVMLLRTSKRHLEERVSADLQFHLALAEAAGNTVLINLMNILSETIRSTLRIVYTQGEAGKLFYKQHRLLYEAIVARDKQEAVRLMKEHLEQSEVWVNQTKTMSN